MFKFDHQQALTYQPLGRGHESSVYTYLEGQDDTKWAVKCIRINDPDKINTLLQNILITTSANSGSVVPIKGHDLHRNRQGDATAYIKMPRMQQSLKDLIQRNRADQQTGIPLHQIVHCFHAIASCLDELAQKEIAHRNLKPSNVLIDRDGHVYLSDLKMVEDKIKEMETIGGYDEDSVYKAPETFYDDWAKNGEDLHKADAWSMGMVIARACLIDKLIPISPELPMEDNRDIIEQNLTMIANRYDLKLAEIVRGLLALNPRERETFSTIRMLLEEAFPEFMIGWLKDNVKEVVGRKGYKRTDVREEAPKFLEESKEESMILDEDLRMGRQIDNSVLLWRGSQEINQPKWIEFRRPEWFKPEWLERLQFRRPGWLQKPQFRRPEWLTRHGLKQGLQKGKKHFKRSIVAILVSLVLLLVVLLSLQSNDIERENKFMDIMTGIQIKHSNYFDIKFDRAGNLNIDAIWGPNFSPYYDETINQQVWHPLNDGNLIRLLDDMSTKLASADLQDHLTGFKFTFLHNCQISDAGIFHLELALVSMRKLKTLSIAYINGRQLTNDALQHMFLVLAAELKDLRSIGLGFVGDREIPYGDTHNLVAAILENSKKLTRFSLFLDQVRLSDDELQDLAYDISDRKRNLEALNLRLQGFSSTDLTISSVGLQRFTSTFLSNLNGLKELSLDFNGSPMTDTALDMLAESMNSHGTKLKRFELNVNDCPSVTNAGLKYFGYQLSRNSLKNLEYLTIQTSWDPISWETREWLRNQMKYVPEVHIRPE